MRWARYKMLREQVLADEQACRSELVERGQATQSRPLNQRRAGSAGAPLEDGSGVSAAQLLREALDAD
jgi:hypothetical protein